MVQQLESKGAVSMLHLEDRRAAVLILLHNQRVADAQVEPEVQRLLPQEFLISHAHLSTAAIFHPDVTSASMPARLERAFARSMLCMPIAVTLPVHERLRL